MLFKLEAQWAEPVSLTFHSVLRKLNTESTVHLAKQFQRRRFLEINQLDTRITYGSNVCQEIGMKLAIFIENLTQMLPTKLQFIWESDFREDFQISTNQKQEWPVAAMFANVSELNKQYLQRTYQGCFLPNLDLFGLAFQRRIFFRNQPIKNKNGMWRTCLLTDRN